VFEENCLDPNYYTSDKIYKMIKKNNVPYNELSKDLIIEMILNFNNNSGNSQKILQRKIVKKRRIRKFRKIGFVSLTKDSINGNILNIYLIIRK
jgi:3'-phosphoadenosine 5'-phosphosulfate sulfotransferase (PAPS reductase)/FAD synthetase